MYFTYAELARLNKIIGTALMSGKVEFDDISESIHKKVSDEIIRRNSPDEDATELEVREW